MSVKPREPLIITMPSLMQRLWCYDCLAIWCNCGTKSRGPNARKRYLRRLAKLGKVEP